MKLMMMISIKMRQCTTRSSLWDTDSTLHFLSFAEEKTMCVFQALCALFTLCEAQITYLNEIFMP